MESDKPQSLRVLLADDESLHVMRLQAWLEEMGHRVVAEAGTGDQAVKLARQTRPDLAILDIKMPGLDGIESAQAIVAENPLPVILITAHKDQELVERAAAAGIFAYLVKPVAAKELWPAIRMAISRFEELMLLHKEVDDLRQALETRKLVERAAAAGIFAYLVKPVDAKELWPAISMALSRFEELMLLRKEVDDLRQALETRKLVERAKGILMKRLSLTEEQAFHRLRRRSQSESRKIGEVAQAVILADKMF